MKHLFLLITSSLCFITWTTNAQQTSELIQTDLKFLDGSIPQSFSNYSLSNFHIQSDFNFITGSNGSLSAGEDLQYSVLDKMGLSIIQNLQIPSLSASYGLDNLVFRSNAANSFDNWTIYTSTEGTDRKSLNIIESFGNDDISTELALHIEPWNILDGIQVGIGTDDPTETLEVAGAIKIQETTDNPTPGVIYGNSAPLAYGFFNQVTSDAFGYGIESITKTATGRYTVVIDNPGDFPFFTGTIFDTNRLGFISHFVVNANTINVRTTNESGTDTDQTFSFVIHGTPQ